MSAPGAAGRVKTVAWCAVALGAGVLAGRLVGQGMIVGGNALDANPMVGSGGNNARAPRRMPMQRDIYTVQDGQMKYNEAAAFASPRYVPVGREGAVQATAMIYSNRTPNNPSLATQTTSRRYNSDTQFRGYKSTSSSDLFSETRYAPRPPDVSRVDPNIDYRVPSATGQAWTPPAQGQFATAPAPGNSTPAATRATVTQRLVEGRAPVAASVTPTPVSESKYRVPGVSYGGVP